MSAALGRHADVDLYPGHALPEVGNVGARRAHIVPNFRDIASQCGVFAARRASHGLDSISALTALRTDSISALRALRTDPISALREPRTDSISALRALRTDPISALRAPRTDPISALEAPRTDPISELNVLRTDSISALEDVRIESCCSTISVAIAIVDAVTVPTTDPTIANVCCRTVFTVPTFGTMVTQHRLGITADSGGFRQK